MWIKLAKALVRKKPKGGKLSLRAISAELAARGGARAPVQPKVGRRHADRLAGAPSLARSSCPTLRAVRPAYFRL